MPIPAPNLVPPFNIVRLSHVELAVTDLAKSRAFYVDTLGLQVTDETADTIYLRALEERGHHCLVLKKSPTAEARDLGFKVFGEDDLDKAARFFQGRGSSGRVGRAALPVANLPHPRPPRHSARISTRRWTACPRSTSNTRSTGA